jgi:hypothetical protein
VAKKQKQPKRLFRQRRGNVEYWPHLTNPRQYRYYFHPKHHGAGNLTDSCWKGDIAHAEEFDIFEKAVALDISDQRGNLYNVRKAADGTILEVGKFHEQLARFWHPRGPGAWHGHPLWPVETNISTNRAGRDYCPNKIVFTRLVARGVLTAHQSHRLNNGKDI